MSPFNLCIDTLHYLGDGQTQGAGARRGPDTYCPVLVEAAVGLEPGKAWHVLCKRGAIEEVTRGAPPPGFFSLLFVALKSAFVVAVSLLFSCSDLFIEYLL